MPGTSTATLPSLSPVAQLRAGRLALRLPQLAVGLFLYGLSMALMLRSGLGLMPWDVLHEGLTHYVPLSFGQVSIVVGALVLLAWWPLRQWPGLGTVANVFVVGLSADAGLALLPELRHLTARMAFLVGGIVLNGLAGAVYIGSQFGPGPRDGLMTGLSRRLGHSMRLWRTIVEVVVLGIGWALGGTVGLGTIAYALVIGAITQFFLRHTVVRLPSAAAESSTRTPEPAADV